MHQQLDWGTVRDARVLNDLRQWWDLQRTEYMQLCEWMEWVSVCDTHLHHSLCQWWDV
eukprot:m.189440 g.189440  ORF g.189440 m.189440 type:complete len:58 (-) comp15428_c0_seq2:189-362(-)